VSLPSLTTLFCFLLGVFNFWGSFGGEKADNNGLIDKKILAPRHHSRRGKRTREVRHESIHDMSNMSARKCTINELALGEPESGAGIRG